MAGMAAKANTTALLHLQQAPANSGHAKRDVRAQSARSQGSRLSEFGMDTAVRRPASCLSRSAKPDAHWSREASACLGNPAHCPWQPHPSPLGRLRP